MINMNNDRKIDAAIGLLGLGKIYPHSDLAPFNNICAACNCNITQEKICYTCVPHYGTDIEEASKLLSVLMKGAPYGMELFFNKKTLKYVFIYKGKEFKEDKIFRSSTPAEGIRQVALFHYKIDINQVTDKIQV